MTRLDILSDPICPWCYIGKAKLEQALADQPDPVFDIEWKPFQLNPDMPPEGMDRESYLEMKFGEDGAQKVYDRIAAAAREAGLEVDFARIKRTPNTLNAHRLLRWARIEKAQNAVNDGLFRRYFVEGEDISDPDVLTATAAQAGMDADLVSRLLASDADVEEVRQEDASAREMGVSGVPTFLIGGRYVVQGAQEPDLWRRVMAELRQLSADAQA
ncbi:MAG: DsbA family oxidoreductase [Pseudomonadota bacterium]